MEIMYIDYVRSRESQIFSVRFVKVTVSFVKNEYNLSILRPIACLVFHPNTATVCASVLDSRQPTEFKTH